MNGHNNFNPTAGQPQNQNPFQPQQPQAQNFGQPQQFQQPQQPQNPFQPQQPQDFNQSQQPKIQYALCSNCHQLIKKGQQFCEYCGQPIYATQAQLTATPPKDKSKKTLLITSVSIAATALVALIVVAIIVGINSGRDSGTRTLMVYMTGSSSESKQSSASTDLQEMIDASKQESTKVVVYTGGDSNWSLNEISADENAIFEIQNGSIEKKQTYQQASMAKAETLTTFINYAYENYKTNLYDLILWGDGGGPIYGYGQDQTIQDQTTQNQTPMSLSVIQEAIKNSTLSQDNRKFEFIGFDAPLMGSIETANALKPYSNYLIASEEIEPNWGWDYSFLGDIKKESKSEEVGQNIVSKFATQYQSYPYTINNSLAMINLSRIDNLIANTNNLFNQVNDGLSISNFSEYSQKLTQETTYGNAEGRMDSTYDLVDLYALASSVASSHQDAFDNFEKAYKEAIVADKSNIQNTNGLSVYFPTTNKSNLSSILSQYESLAFSNDYYAFLKNYSSLNSGQKLAPKINYSSDTTTTIANKITSVTIPEEISNNYQYATYKVWRKLNDTDYMPVYSSTDIQKDGNVLTMRDGSKQIALAKDSNDQNPGWVTSWEVERTSEYAIYGISASLTRTSDDSTASTNEVDSANNLNPDVNILFKIPNGETTGKITDIRYLKSKNNLSAKGGINLENWNTISINNLAYSPYDANNNLLNDWETTSKKIVTKTTIEPASNNLELRILDLNHDFNSWLNENAIQNSTDYYCQFVVVDTQGNEHNLDMVQIQI